MVKKILGAAALLGLCLVVFTSCGSLTFSSAENLVRPPKLSGDDGQLQDAFEAAVSDKGEYILRYPSAGSYRSAFVRYDCDSDGDDEAFVFYSLKAEEMSVYMYMLDYSEGEWRAVGEVPGDGSDIYSVEFCDLNEDGVAELLVGWSSLDSKSNKKLSVYCSYKNSQSLNYRVLITETYTNMYTVDLDNDGEKEILLALINSTSDTYTTDARLLKMTEDDKGGFLINALGQVSLYSEITAFLAINSCVIDGVTYVFIDESAGESYLTEILYWDDEKDVIVAPVQVDVMSVSSCPTARSLNLVCTDIDSDGQLEIPGTTLMANSGIIRENAAENTAATQTTVNENIYITKWSKYDGGSFTVVQQYIANSDDGFIFDYDEELMRDWSVSFYPDRGMTQFFTLRRSEDRNIPDESVLLFTITAVELSETVSMGAYIMSGAEYKYIYEITEDGENAGVTRQMIFDSFATA